MPLITNKPQNGIRSLLARREASGLVATPPAGDLALLPPGLPLGANPGWHAGVEPFARLRYRNTPPQEGQLTPNLRPLNPPASRPSTHQEHRMLRAAIAAAARTAQAAEGVVAGSCRAALVGGGSLSAAISSSPWGAAAAAAAAVGAAPWHLSSSSVGGSGAGSSHSRGFAHSSRHPCSGSQWEVLRNQVGRGSVGRAGGLLAGCCTVLASGCWFLRAAGILQL